MFGWISGAKAMIWGGIVAAGTVALAVLGAMLKRSGRQAQRADQLEVDAQVQKEINDVADRGATKSSTLDSLRRGNF